MEPAGVLHPGVVFLLPLLEPAVTVETLHVVRPADVEETSAGHHLLLLPQPGRPVLEGGQSDGLGGELSVDGAVVGQDSLADCPRACGGSEYAGSCRTCRVAHVVLSASIFWVCVVRGHLLALFEKIIDKSSGNE